MDDGLDYTHPDFSSKFRQEGSYRDPMPGVCKSYLDASHEHPEEVYADSHGTTCGAIATADDNDQVRMNPLRPRELPLPAVSPRLTHL